jgi:hypothetical protein
MQSLSLYINGRNNYYIYTHRQLNCHKQHKYKGGKTQGWSCLSDSTPSRSEASKKNRKHYHIAYTQSRRILPTVETGKHCYLLSNHKRNKARKKIHLYAIMKNLFPTNSPKRYFINYYLARIPAFSFWSCFE